MRKNKLTLFLFVLGFCALISLSAFAKQAEALIWLNGGDYIFYCNTFYYGTTCTGRFYPSGAPLVSCTATTWIPEMGLYTCYKGKNDVPAGYYYVTGNWPIYSAGFYPN